MKLTANDDNLDMWLGAAVPRYTSYPPATAFHGAVGASDYAASLAKLPPEKPISLYIHIPFCDALCLYCGCNTGVTHRESRIERYLAALKQEMRMVVQYAAQRSGQRLSVSHLHFGGGTPNIMSPQMTHDLFAELRQHFDFSQCKEIAVELDPRVATQEKIQAFAECGVTRASLGVQDFKDDVQELVQRIQPYEMVEQVCAWLRASGINSINFDLMYGLPLQTPESVAQTALQVCALAPDRIALFSYAHLPRLKKHQQALEPHGIPDSLIRLAMDDAARDAFIAQGYVAVGMDHFAKPDDGLVHSLNNKTLRRNFQGYTDDATDTLIALGASSISQTPDGFFQNERLTDAYQNIIKQNTLATPRGYKMNDDDRLRGAIIEAFMCNLSCDIEKICNAFGADIGQFAHEFERLAQFEARGLVRRDGRTVTLTSCWRMPIRVIAHVFDTHAQGMPTGFSKVA